MSVAQLLRTHRYCYILDETVPGKIGGTYLVGIAVEDVRGYYPTGRGKTLPYYWDRQTCDLRNRGMGLSEEDVVKITLSSMRSRRGQKEQKM